MKHAQETERRIQTKNRRKEKGVTVQAHGAVAAQIEQSRETAHVKQDAVTQSLLVCGMRWHVLSDAYRSAQKMAMQRTRSTVL